MSDMHDSDDHSKTGKILGFSALAVTVVATIIVYIYVYWKGLGIYWHWYFIAAIGAVLVAQLVFTFVLQKLGKFIQPALMLIFVVSIALALWFASSVNYVSFPIDNEIKKTLNSNIVNDIEDLNRKVYILLDSADEAGVDAEKKPTLTKADIEKVIKPEIEAFEKETKVISGYVLINFQNLKNMGDATLAWKQAKKIWYTNHMKRGFVVLQGKGLSKAAKDDGVSTIDKAEFEKIITPRKEGGDAKQTPATTPAPAVTPPAPATA